ncbi:MAG: hypothetical protein Q9160_006226 [Pyrenula sp. 1 TL-2023]
MVCESCTEIIREVLENWKQWKKGLQHRVLKQEYSITLAQLRRASEERCCICHSIVANNETILKRIFSRSSEQLPGTRFVSITFGYGSTWMETQIQFKSKIWKHLFATIQCFYVFALCHTCRGQLSCQHRGTASNGDQMVFQLALRWFQQCNKDHRLCRHSDQDPGPSRLIDLAPSFEDGTCRLIESSSRLRGGYATLSHRWRDKTPKLTTDNLKNFVTGIPWRQMPGVFRDACRIARLSGVRYLWIDSIWMLQDKRDDLVEELQRMQDIYSNAVVNISALAADADSLFTTRNSVDITRYNALLQPSKHGVDFPTILMNVEIWENLVDLSALGGRAPALGNGGRNSFLEAPHALDYLFDGVLKTIRQAISPPLENIRTTAQYVGSASLFREWMNFVTLYSRRELTFPSDKLPAISGISKRFVQVTKYHWAVGLWLEQMPSSLLWYAHPPDRKQDAYPTWSWASQIRGIHGAGPLFSSSSVLVVSKMFGVDCKTVDSNPFGCVSQGIIRLLAPTVKLVTNNTTGRTSLWSEKGAIVPCQVTADASDHPLRRNDGFNFSGSDISSDHEIHSSGPQLVAILIAAYVYDSEYSAEGLVLEKVFKMANYTQRPVYRRVGHFKISHDAGAGVPPGLPPDVFIQPDDFRRTLDFDEADFLTEFTII